MAEIVFALYRPRPGREAELAALVDGHVAELRRLGLASGRAPIVARSRKDGTIVEVFEWASAEAIARAHRDPAVQEIWARLGDCAEFPTFAQLAEAAEAFAGFEPVTVAAQRARRSRSAKPARPAARERVAKRAAPAKKKRGR